MTDAGEKPVGYSIDTMIIIDGRIRRYPPDVFGQLWANLETLIHDGRAVVADEVVFELERGHDDCRDWAVDQPELVAASDDAVLECVQMIAERFPDWSSERQNWADPFVIAHAYTRGWAVVTEEQWSRSPLQERTKVPNVCHALGVECMDFLGMMRREGWRV